MFSYYCPFLDNVGFVVAEKKSTIVIGKPRLLKELGPEYLSLLALHSAQLFTIHKVQNKAEQKFEYKNGMYFIAFENNELSKQIGTIGGSEN